MDIAECMRDEGTRGLLMRAPASSLLHGALRLEETVPSRTDEKGWVRPWRVGAEQARALESCLAWHPGLYAQMARTCAGICVELVTDAEEIALEVRVDPEPRGTAAQLRLVDPSTSRGAYDGVSCEFDGRPPVCKLPTDDVITFLLVERGAPAPGTSRVQPRGSVRALPGLAPERHVRLWLPCLRGCVVRDVLCDGTFIRPVPPRPVTLVLGDSICQGFVAGDPALTWPARMSRALGCDVVNQGIGGQVFQESSLAGLDGLVDPKRIIVALGANYRFDRCTTLEVTRGVHAFLNHVGYSWPQVPCWVLTPTWHSEKAYPSHQRSCFSEVPDIIAAEVERHDTMRLVDGLTLMDHDSDLLADRCDHPSARGSAQMAERICAVLEPSPEPPGGVVAALGDETAPEPQAASAPAPVGASAPEVSPPAASVTPIGRVPSGRSVPSKKSHPTNEGKRRRHGRRK